jgi:DNA-binding PadR family transcriptional regulator
MIDHKSADAGLKLGQLEQLMLLAVLRLGDNAYGITIQREIEDWTRKPLSVPLLYTTLHRLLKKGALSDRVCTRRSQCPQMNGLLGSS